MPVYQSGRKTVDLTVKVSDWVSPVLQELLDRMYYLAEFYTPIISEALPRMEDDGGPIYDEEEGRHKCQAISS